MTRWRLVPRPVAPWLAALVLVCATGVALLGRHFADTEGPTILDTQIDGRVVYRLAAHPRALDLLIRAGNPETLIGVAAVLTVLCAAMRRPRAAVFAATAAPLAAVATEKILKPLINRTTAGDSLTFPSGHTTGAFALAMTVVILLLPHRGYVRAPAVVARTAAAAAVLATAAGTAIATIALRWHYASDTVGGAGVAVGVVGATALVVDAAAETLRTNRGRNDRKTTLHADTDWPTVVRR